MSFEGLHNAAFSERATCAGAWDEVSCHKFLVLCDKRIDFREDEDKQLDKETLFGRCFSHVRQGFR